MLHLFPEENPTGNGEETTFLTCEELRDVIKRALDTWAVNHRTIYFRDVSDQCADVNTTSGCAYAEIFIVASTVGAPGTSTNSDQAALAVTTFRAGRVYTTAGERMAVGVEISGAVIHVRAPASPGELCWYLDSTFCWYINMWQGEDIDVVLIARIVCGVLFCLAVLAVLYLVGMSFAAACCLSKPNSNPDEPPRAPEPAYKIGDRVYVKRSSGDECIAFVTQYDASKKYYMVDLDRIGSGKLKQCRDKEMRPATQASIIVTRSNGDEKRGIVQDFDEAAKRYNIRLEGTGIIVSAAADKVRPAGPQVGSTVLVMRIGGDEKRAVVDAFDPATNMYVVQLAGSGSQFQVHADRVRTWLPKSGSRANMFQRPNACGGLEKSCTLQLKPNEMVGMTVNEFNKITAVDPNSAASNAGLHVGDLILAVDDVDCTEGVTAAKLWKEGAGHPVRKLRIVADANLVGSSAGGAIPRRVTVQGTGQSGNEIKGKALVAAMGTDASSKRAPVVSFRADLPGQPRSARVADEDSSERPKQKRPPPSAFGAAVNGVLGTALDDELLASHPDAVELIAAGVPREEVLQGLRPGQSLRGVPQGEQAAAPVTAPSTASSVDGAPLRQRLSIFFA